MEYLTNFSKPTDKWRMKRYTYIDTTTFIFRRLVMESFERFMLGFFKIAFFIIFVLFAVITFVPMLLEPAAAKQKLATPKPRYADAEGFSNYLFLWYEYVQEVFGVVGLFLPLIAVVVIALILLAIIRHTYGLYLKSKYDFRIFMNWPGIITMVCYGICYIAMGDLEPETVVGAVIMLLIFGSPGLVPYFINCLRKTKNPVHAVVCTVLMWPFYMLFGAVSALVIGLAIFGLIMGKIGGDVMKDSLTNVAEYDVERVCPRCGAKLAGEGTCPFCG
jgi:hypothetical protein